MTFDFTKLEYLSMYGSDFIVSVIDNSSIRLVGSAAPATFASGSANFVFGYPEQGTPGDSGYLESAAIPNAFCQFYVNGDTPNDITRWYETENNPRPLQIPTSGGNVNLQIHKYRLPSTSSNPTTWVFVFEIFNFYAVAVTFDYTFNYIAYCIANT